MFSVQRSNNGFRFIAGLNGAVIKTVSAGEQPKVVNLGNLFPKRLYNRLTEVVTPESVGYELYGTVTLNVPQIAIAPQLMVKPETSGPERMIRIFWFEANEPRTTKFDIRLRVSEVEALLSYIDQHMTC